MYILNGKEQGDGSIIVQPQITVGVTVYTDDQTVKVTQTGWTLVMNASTNDKTFTLPAVDASDVGIYFDFRNIATGKLTIDTDGADTIDAGQNIYSTTDNLAACRVKLITATKWFTDNAVGTWAITAV